jgi:hypothetical protein
MRNSKTPKIVVAVVLAAVYGTGVAMVMLRDAPGKRPAPNAAVAPATQMVEQPVVEQSVVEQPVVEQPVVEQPAAMTAAPAPVAGAAVNKLEASPRRAEPVKAEVPAREMSIAREQGIASSMNGSTAEAREVEKPGSFVDVATDDEPASPTDDAPSSGLAESAPDGDDSQVVADVGT